MAASFEGIEAYDTAWLDLLLSYPTMAKSSPYPPSASISPPTSTSKWNQSAATKHGDPRLYNQQQNAHQPQAAIQTMEPQLSLSSNQPETTDQHGSVSIHNHQQDTIHQGEKNHHLFDLNLPCSEQQCNNENHHLFDLNQPCSEQQCNNDDWSLAEGDTIEYEWTNEYVETDHIVEWFEESDNEQEIQQQASDNEVHTQQEASVNLRQRRIRHVLNNHERQLIATTLLAHSNNCTKIPHGMINELANQYSVHRLTISRIWKQAMKQFQAGENVDVRNKKAGKVGRKSRTVDPQSVMSVPLRKRTTLRSLALALNMSKSTLHRLVKKGEIKAHSNPMKPNLTFAHKYARMQWCISSIIPHTIRTIPRFQDMYNVIHVDEKWFMMSKVSQKYYLAPDEPCPYRSCRSKRFLAKAMFFAAIGRPIYDSEGNLISDGKIGIWPFTEKVPAKRSSKNRPAGTLETKAMQSIKQAEMKVMFIQNLLPAIREKWPWHITTTVWIQQDNAKPHIDMSDPEFLAALNEGEGDIRLINQPAQSPDLNVLDLGFFRAIQSLKEQTAPKNVDELVKSVEDAYHTYEPRLVNHIFLSLQYCMCEILKVKGGNDYQNPHNKKAVLEREGLLPISVELTRELVDESIEWLRHGYLEDQDRENTEQRQSNEAQPRQSMEDQICNTH